MACSVAVGPIPLIDGGNVQREEILVDPHTPLDYGLQQSRPSILRAGLAGEGFVHDRVCVALCIEDDLPVQCSHVGEVAEERAGGDAGPGGDGLRRRIETAGEDQFAGSVQDAPAGDLGAFAAAIPGLRRCPLGRPLPVPRIVRTLAAVPVWPGCEVSP